jgi:hypothetical protein
MHTYVIRGTIKQHSHCFLRTPHRFILIVHLYALFLSFYLKDKELGGAVSYFSSFSHLNIFKGPTDCKYSKLFVKPQSLTVNLDKLFVIPQAPFMMVIAQMRFHSETQS